MLHTKEEIESLITGLDSIISACNNLEKKFAGELFASNPAFRKSTRNLLHYLALRNRDIRHMQEKLADLGLSSLGRSEGFVKTSLLTVRNNLALIYNLPLREESA
jgi:pyruvate kinase